MSYEWLWKDLQGEAGASTDDTKVPLAQHDSGTFCDLTENPIKKYGDVLNGERLFMYHKLNQRSSCEVALCCFDFVLILH